MILFDSFQTIEKSCQDSKLYFVFFLPVSLSEILGPKPSVDHFV